MRQAKYVDRHRDRRHLAVLLAGLVLAGALIVLALLSFGHFSSSPQLSLPDRTEVVFNSREEFLVDLDLNRLGEETYPAVSVSVGFDPRKLEFLGVRSGNVYVPCSGSPTGQIQPQWHVEQQDGTVRALYLDLSDGDSPFRQNLLNRKNNVLLRLAFRLRDGVDPGDQYTLAIQDAVFAASDERLSLASSTGTLQTRDGLICLVK